MNPIAALSSDSSFATDRLRRPPQFMGPANAKSSLADSTPTKSSGGSEELQEAFQDFVGQTLFGSMLASMRKTLEKPAYMHGGRAEEVFQQQMDQHLVENITSASASSIAGPMFDLFNLQRRSS